MARRWKCPNCGSAINAPERMAMDDTRRYCMVCSQTTGRLVGRESPALARRRTVNTERAANKATSKRARDARAKVRAAQRERERLTFHGLHVLDEAGRLWALPCAQRQRTRMRMSNDLPKIAVRRSTGGINSMYPTGRAWPNGLSRGRVALTISSEAPRSRILDMIAHELAHCLCPREHHGDGFVAMLADLVHEGYGVSVPLGAADDAPGPDLRAYRYDELVIDALDGREGA